MRWGGTNLGAAGLVAGGLQIRLPAVELLVLVRKRRKAALVVPLRPISNGASFTFNSVPKSLGLRKTSTAAAYSVFCLPSPEEPVGRDSVLNVVPHVGKGQKQGDFRGRTEHLAEGVDTKPRED